MTGICRDCGYTDCDCQLMRRLERIREKTQGVNIYALETGDLLFLIENLEKEWGEG